MGNSAGEMQLNLVTSAQPSHRNDGATEQDLQPPSKIEHQIYIYVHTHICRSPYGARTHTHRQTRAVGRDNGGAASADLSTQLWCPLVFTAWLAGSPGVFLPEHHAGQIIPMHTLNHEEHSCQPPPTHTHSHGDLRCTSPGARCKLTSCISQCVCLLMFSLVLPPH